jgi:hypothetical protein
MVAESQRRLTTYIPEKGRKVNQLSRRGWSTDAVDETVNHPFATRRAANKANGNPAAAYFNQDGSYVIRDDVTGVLVQLSDRTNSQNWIPDDAIVDPYIP